MRRASWDSMRNLYQGFKDDILSNIFNLLFISSQNSVADSLFLLTGYSSRLKAFQLTNPSKDIIISFYRKELGVDYATAVNLAETIGLDLERATSILSQYQDGNFNLNGKTIL